MSSQSGVSSAASILDDDFLLRAISPDWIVAGVNGLRISSQALRPSSPQRGGGLSVDLKTMMERQGVDPKDFLSKRKKIAAGHLMFQVKTAKSVKNGSVVLAPVLEPGDSYNPFHANVWWDKELSRTEMNQIFDQCVWLEPVEGVTLRL